MLALENVETWAKWLRPLCHAGRHGPDTTLVAVVVAGDRVTGDGVRFTNI